MPFEEWHGQKKLNYEHPAFPDDEPERWLQEAFDQDYQENSSSMYRMAETSLRGYEHLLSLDDKDACLDTRTRQLADQAREFCLMLPTIIQLAVNGRERRRAQALNARAIHHFGRTPKEQVIAMLALTMANRWRRRLAQVGDVMQPRTICTRFVTSPTGQRRQPGSTLKRALVRLPAVAMAASIIALWS
jgi:hypothetical protein